MSKDKYHVGDKILYKTVIGIKESRIIGIFDSDTYVVAHDTIDFTLVGEKSVLGMCSDILEVLYID